MELEFWKHQQWMFHKVYPKGTKYFLVIIVLLFSFLLTIIFGFRYSAYQTFYGTVIENGENTLKIAIPIHELESFLKVVEEEKVTVQKIDDEVQLGTGENIIYVYAIVSVSNQLLIKNNIIPIRLKVRSESIWEALSKKWKKGMKYERN